MASAATPQSRGIGTAGSLSGATNLAQLLEVLRCLKKGGLTNRGRPLSSIGRYLNEQQAVARHELVYIGDSIKPDNRIGREAAQPVAYPDIKIATVGEAHHLRL